VTVNGLLSATRRRRTSSDGRVLQIVKRAQAIGWIAVAPGAGDWKARPLIARPAFIETWRARARVEIDAASLVCPTIRPALALVEDDAHFRAFLTRLYNFDAMAHEARGPANPSIRLFLQHHNGLMILYDLLVAQAADRTRFLESAPLSRLALSKHHRVARSHVAALLAAAAEAGHLSLEQRNRVAFSEAMSEEAERHFALTFHAIASCALAAMESARIATTSTMAPQK
jgi:hypothetical protein